MKALLLFLSTSLFIISCSNKSETELPESEVIAIVGDVKVTIDLLNAYMAANGLSGANEEVAGQAFEALLSEVAMSNIALKKQLPLTAEQLNTLEYLKIRTQAQAAQADYLTKNIITEQEILKEYEKAKSQTGGLEFYVHHLLYKDEIEAIKALDQIKSAEDYLKHEKVFLESNKNMRNVGELGWVSLGQLPASFKDKLLITEKNSVVSDVIVSQFGAHVVYLKDTRQLQAPALETVKQGIINTLKGQKISNFKQLARAKAHIMLKK